MAQMVTDTGKEEKAVKKPSAASKRTQDKWKKKKWFKIFSPAEFEKREIGETVGEKPKLLMNRIIRVNLGDLTAQRKKRHIYLSFCVNDIQGTNAFTRVTGHHMIPSYVGRLVRRHNSKMEVTRYLDLGAEGTMKVKAVAVSSRKLAQSQETAIRNRMVQFLTEFGQGRPFGQIVQDFAFGTAANKLFDEIKSIAPLKRVEISESALMGGETGNDSGQ